MRIQELRGADRKSKRRVGRGTGSGLGKTSGKGHKGQKARAGSGKGAGFEGGQMPLQRRLPKRGFNNIFGLKYKAINLKDLAKVASDTITPEVLLKHGVIKSLGKPVKILGEGAVARALNVRADAFSASARKKIEEAGGRAEVI